MVGHEIVMLNCSSIALESYQFTHHARLLWYQKTGVHLTESIDRLGKSRPGGPLKEHMRLLWEGVFKEE
jgi:hypothetical protein